MMGIVGSMEILNGFMDTAGALISQMVHLTPAQNRDAIARQLQYAYNLGRRDERVEPKPQDPNWLQEQAEAAALEVASWPKWKRDAYRAAMRG